MLTNRTLAAAISLSLAFTLGWGQMPPFQFARQVATLDRTKPDNALVRFKANHCGTSIPSGFCH